MGLTDEPAKIAQPAIFQAVWRGIGKSFQSAITAPRMNLTGYGNATAQSWLFNPVRKLVIDLNFPSNVGCNFCTTEHGPHDSLRYKRVEPVYEGHRSWLQIDTENVGTNTKTITRMLKFEFLCACACAMHKERSFSHCAALCVLMLQLHPGNNFHNFTAAITAHAQGTDQIYRHFLRY